MSRALLILLFIGGPILCKAEGRASMCRLAEEAMKSASLIRGLRPKGAVPCLVRDRADVERFLKEMIATRLPPNKIKLEELVYETLGVIPRDYDYANDIVQLYASQIGGYFDPEKKHYVMASWIPAALQATVTVHELTHALQDQYFNLEKIIDPTIENGDLLLAHSALVEGDATAVMMDFQRRELGQNSLQEEASVDYILMQQVMSGALNIGGESTPPALKALLVFPYTSGLRFVHALSRKGGYAEVDNAFRRLPTTTKEILHPEIYLAGKAPAQEIPMAQLEELAGSKGAIYSDTLGEFAISAMLTSAVKTRADGVEAANGWMGDRVAVFERDARRATVVWHTLWETERDAKEFATAYGELIKNRYGTELGHELTVLGEGESIRKKENGRAITLLFDIKITDSFGETELQPAFESDGRFELRKLK